jgi:hypothetical protein
MNPQRLRHLSSIAVTAIIAACSASSPSNLPGASTAAGGPSSAPSTPSTTPTTPVATPSPTPSGPLGGGLLLVYQFDDKVPTSKARTESIYTLDLGTGAKRKLGSLPVSEGACCPDGVVWSADRSRAFLFNPNFRGRVELSSGTIISATRRTAHFDVRVSNRGDRLAWVDYMTGTNESIVIADLDSKQLRRLTLPTGAWQSELSWSPDDSALAVATHLPLQAAQASHIRLASIIACCSIDRGVQATHLLMVPVDGSPIRDLLDDGAKVAQDQAEPFPTPPPDAKTPGLPAHAERWLEPGEWSPDGRTVLLTTRVCSPTWNIASTHVRRTCTDSVSIVDVESARETVLIDKMPWVGSARWSPDGRRVSFLAGQEGSEDGLFVMDRDGGHVRRLGDGWGDNQPTGLAVWSPNGAWIAFQRFISNDVEEHYHLSVWVMPVDGGAARWVADHAIAGW